ncbi:Transmembrane protein [Trema orientale]|uniref:Transmembrane protein n=1 Tax=Trema orientale TaxID=63057 RepID=A0A2P5B588_TREOI|nr:Transmembrane protein [Trema orientale]
MMKTLNLESPLLLSRRSLSFNQIHETNASLHITIFGTRPPTLGLTISNSHRIQIHKFICARKRKRRTGSERTTRFMLNLMAAIASNLKIFPQPLNLVLEEFGGGDGSGGGGGLGLWKGFGWGGFDGWRRKRRRKWWLYGFLIICGLGFLFGREIESNVAWWGLGFGPLGVALIQFWEKNGGIQFWVLGFFCLWSFLVGVAFRREELQKWVGRFSLPSSMVESVRRQRRRRRRKPGRAF